MWHITNQKVPVRWDCSYQTAWAWLHKMRRAMIRPGREKLSGFMEVNETYVGGLEEDAHGRHTEKKAILVIAV